MEKPIGDLGQRYEVRCTMDGVERAFGWSHTMAGVNSLIAMIAMRRDMTAPRFVDRHESRQVRRRKARR